MNTIAVFVSLLFTLLQFEGCFMEYNYPKPAVRLCPGTLKPMSKFSAFFEELTHIL